MRYIFANYELDTKLYELRCAGEAVPLEPLAFNLLTYLIQHRDRSVSKDELVEHLWPAQCIGDASLVQSMVKARRAIGDNGQEQRSIKTITGHGYRFIAPVEEDDAVRHEAQARAPTPIALEASSIMTGCVTAPCQNDAELQLQELLAAGRVQGLAFVPGLPGQGEDDQEQAVFLVIRLFPAHTAQAKQDAQRLNVASKALQRCATRPGSQPGSGKRPGNMPDGSPVAAGWVRAAARHNCCVQQAVGRR